MFVKPRIFGSNQGINYIGRYLLEVDIAPVLDIVAAQQLAVLREDFRSDRFLNFDQRFGIGQPAERTNIDQPEQNDHQKKKEKAQFDHPQQHIFPQRMFL